MKYTSDNKKTLVKESGYLSKDEHIEIFKIIKANTDQYTKNDNGIFINLSILDDKLFEKIYKFVNFCIDNRKTLDEKDEVIKLEKNKMFNKIDKEYSEEHDKTDDQKIVKTNNEELKIKDDNNIEKVYDNNNKDIVEEEEEEELEGAKISLKKSKPKYTGTKAKIIKNYKQNGNNIQNIIYKNNKSENKKNNTEYNIGEESYEDYLEDNNDDYLEDNTKNIDDIDDIDDVDDVDDADVVDDVDDIDDDYEK